MSDKGKEFLNDDFSEPQEDESVRTTSAGDSLSAVTNKQADDEFADDTENFDDDLPVRNGITEEPESEAKESAKGSLRKTVFITVMAVVAVFAIAVFFVFMGKNSRTDAEAVVKDTRQSVNTNVFSADNTDYYKEAYEKQVVNANSAVNVNPASNQQQTPNLSNITTVGSQLPPPDSPLFAATPNPNKTPEKQTEQNSDTKPGGGGGRTVVRRDTTDTNQPEIVEMPDNRRNVTNARATQVSLYFVTNSETDGGLRNGQRTPFEFERRSVAKPVFGTVLPIRVLGRLHSLGSSGLVRMELTRTVEGSWGSLPRGTLFVGRVAGSADKRLFVSLLGFIDNRTRKLVTIGGDLQGLDGALGLEGDVRSMNSRWNKIFGGLLKAAQELGNSYLLGRRGGGGTVVNTFPVPNGLGQGQPDRKYVVVEAGKSGYLVINDLPPALEQDERLAGNNQGLSDGEILQMIEAETDEQLEERIPTFSPKGREIARQVNR